MDLNIIQGIFDSFIPFSIAFAVSLALMEWIFQYIIRTAFGSKKDII